MQDHLILAFLMTAGANVADPGDGLAVERASCRVHGPSRLASQGDTGSSDYVPHYRGECRDGVAHGQGRLEWRMRWTPGRNKAVWEGRFVDGVFVGTQAVTHVRPLPGDRYLILLADDGPRRVWLLSRSGQFDPVSVCDIDHVIVDANPAGGDAAFDPGDDAQVRAALTHAAGRVSARCPAADALLFELYEHPFQLGPNDNWPTNAFASANVSNLHSDAVAIDGYRNVVSDRARQAARAGERAALLQSQRDRVQAFANANAIEAWLTADSVDRNPYAWQGRRIGMLLRLERMLDAHTALATQATEDGGSVIVVTGVTPSTFAGAATAVVVDVDSECASVAGIAQPLARVRLVAAEACADRACATWQHGIAWRAAP